ncbi:hypothetical protein NDU88_001552 [Pleurodeles waltl]|uniref:Uncharacterized protein n=1 Tax=Pleurodeles waltl TaxID=8319 RepID=A0AAV7M8I0_PLEWA|nr:hypothetical protein NDU88_001552 [Pleurodeles waltl]
MPRTPADLAIEPCSLQERRNSPGEVGGREYEVPDAKKEQQGSAAEGRLTPKWQPRSREQSETRQNRQ